LLNARIPETPVTEIPETVEPTKSSMAGADANPHAIAPVGLRAHGVVGWGALTLAVLESICTGAMLLSGVRVALGFSSLLAAGVAGPARGFHSNAIRIPLLTLAGLGACLNLVLYWNEERIRNNPAARWRLRPLTVLHRRRSKIQVVTALLTFVFIALELITHPFFHHEI
jgi:hypothetical protein